MNNILEYLEQTMKNIPNPDKPAFISELSGKFSRDNPDGNHSGNGSDYNHGYITQDCLSFRELNDQSRSIGSYIAELNLRKQPIAVFMEKKPAMIAAFFGVVRSGNYYVPLDAEIPAFRRDMILDIVNPPLIICDEATFELLSGKTAKFNEIFTFPINEKALSDISKAIIDTDPLYVMFTSGSTGSPKGVVATHRGVIDYIENLTSVLEVTSDTIFGNQSPFYLDACLKEIYSTIKYGATTYLIPQSLFMFPVKLIDYITLHKINTICWVASALSLVAGLGALSVKTPYTLHTIAFGSEVFPIKNYNMWRTALPDARFVHLYGPTEATGMSCYYITNRTYDDNEAIPIGYPFPNTEIILLSDDGTATKGDEIGEICIRGAGLALGYFSDPEKTAAAFVQSPLSVYPDTIYKTGDLGRRSANGELYFVTRRDHQIKHMGYRIELAEIELLATTYDGISLACAVYDDISSKILLYYTGKDVTKSEVKAFLKSNLPRYMLPHTVEQLVRIPLTPGGKLDRVGLLEKHRQKS